MASPKAGGMEALHRLKSTEPPLWLSPTAELSEAARIASQYLFSSLQPFCPKSPFDRLLVDGFDAEQIWQQIDLQSQPLLSNLRREIKRFERNPVEISKLITGENVKEEVERKTDATEKENGVYVEENGGELGNLEELEDMEDEEMGISDEDDEDDAEDEEEEEQQEEEQGGLNGGSGGIEDRFLKIKELEEYLEKDEEREYGVSKGKQRDDHDEDGGEDDDDDDEDGEEEDDELGEFGANADDDDEKFENARYEEFFVKKMKKNSRKRSRSHGGEDSGTDDEQENEGFNNQKKENLSTHEKQVEKLRSKIEQMEKANLEPKTWTMQGEITAMKRPKNSALEVDLDFEHNVRPAPVITEEVTASLEDLIKKRILEEHFDDVQKVPSLPSKAPRELKELDDNKSKKGLAEVYEEEYVQKTGLATATLSFSDEQKKEASLLFKKLCLKLDALSHFHFTPKPVIEDMSIQANVPALAMEEIAPVAVSDAAMLAPEEVFAGKGDLKEEAELSKEERKRRRAKKKRRSKADKATRTSKKTLLSHPIGKEEV